MKTHPLFATTLAALALGGSPAHAHHSFAVHYDANKTVTKTGVVKEFRFTNPHGILMLDVTNDAGKVEHWTVETTAPVYMRRFGWTKDMIKPGDSVVVEGYASRDGSHLMRIRQVKRPDGTPIGGRQNAGDQ
jgi:DNA/RNA endonuclease YhcR with UshA esterase domain